MSRKRGEGTLWWTHRPERTCHDPEVGQVEDMGPGVQGVTGMTRRGPMMEAFSVCHPLESKIHPMANRGQGCALRSGICMARFASFTLTPVTTGDWWPESDTVVLGRHAVR